jgi:hypothetical protein
LVAGITSCSLKRASSSVSCSAVTAKETSSSVSSVTVNEPSVAFWTVMPAERL